MRKKLALLLPLLGMLLAAALYAAPEQETMMAEKPMSTTLQTDRAIFAGGCFWCMEQPFEKLDGVVSATSGYTGGRVINPAYKQVSAGGTGHTEAVEIIYDPNRISYQQLLEVFWMQIDPTDADGQFVDRGNQYRSGIYPLDAEQRQLAETSKRTLAESGRFKQTIITEIVPAGVFYPAEEYHQDYYKKNPLRYKYYRYGSGRDRFLDRVWGEDRKGSS